MIITMIERELWAAVLVRAARDMAGVDLHVEQSEVNLLHRSAHAWIESPRSSIGSFRWVCASLDIDPNFARREIMKFADHLSSARRVMREFRQRMPEINTIGPKLTLFRKKIPMAVKPPRTTP